VGGRILAACDAYEAITSRRSYQQPMEPQAAVDYLQSRVGSLLDPAVYAALRTAVGRGRALTFLE
jgi:HD-GYP domain-containing protein (c-di-GMP phosphodiesterase class II)